MAFLRVEKGNCPGQVLPLGRERMVLGRHPKCEIVVDNAAVSRQHAQILESHGTYYVEDLHSRNHTYLNNRLVEGRIELRPGDQIKICDVVFSFHEKFPSEPGDSTDDILTDEPRQYSRARERGTELLGEIDPSEAVSDKSSIITTLNAVTGSSFRLGINPEAKLRAVLEISDSIAGVLDPAQVLDGTLEGLFKIFPQADAGFALLKDPGTRKLVVKATKSRLVGENIHPRISMTVIKQALQTGDAILSADAQVDDRFTSSESVSDFKIRSVMCVPLVGSSRRVLGVLQIDARDAAQQFSQSDLDVVISVASQVSLAIENSQLHEELLKQRILERDLEFANQVQLGFLPNERPKLPGFEFYDFYEAALRVGGDYFDYIALPNDRLAVAIGDVAGKGVPAALLMARLFSSARFQLLTRPTVCEALAGLNRELSSCGLGHRFVTCVLVVVEPRESTLQIANAGHLPPLVRRTGGQVEVIGLKESGMPLGIAPEQDFRQLTVALAPGDVCLLYTDGITEAMGRRNELYGRQRLCEYLAHGPEQIGDLVRGLVADVEAFCDGRAQRDDVCIVGLRRCK